MPSKSTISRFPRKPKIRQDNVHLGISSILAPQAQYLVDCLRLSDSGGLARAAFRDPNYTALIHYEENNTKIFLRNLKYALGVLINQEHIDLLNDSFQPDALYFFDLEELEAAGLAGPNKPLNSLARTLELMKYFLGFDPELIDSKGLDGLLFSGRIIPACVHGSVTGRDRVYNGENKIDLLYPEWNYTTSISLKPNIKLEVRPARAINEQRRLILTNISTGRQLEDTRIVNSIVGSAVIYSTKGKSAVFDQIRAIIRVVELSYSASWFEPIIESKETIYAVKGGHRGILAGAGNIKNIMIRSAPQERGWIQYVNGKWKCMLSASCIYSALTMKALSYQHSIESALQFHRGAGAIAIFYDDRGYKIKNRQRWAPSLLRHDNEIEKVRGVLYPNAPGGNDIYWAGLGDQYRAAVARTKGT